MKSTGYLGSRRVQALVAALAIFAFVPSRAWSAPPSDVPLADSAETEPELTAWNYVLPFGIMVFQNMVFWGFARLVMDTDYSNINRHTVKRNFTVGFEWDVDAFPTNQLGHPYQGGLYFGAARASKLGFWTSTLYAFAGSLHWEMFMESELPSYNDLVTTTFGGVATGEVLYRLSSAILDPSTSGAERAAREIAATLISPTVGLTRLINGEVFEDGPRSEASDISVDIEVGPDRLRADDSNLELSSMNLGLDIEYGATTPRADFKPFDWFRFTASVNMNDRAVQRGAIDVLALLTRYDFGCGIGVCLLGVNQHYSYVDTPIFKVGTSSVGGTFGGRFPLMDRLLLKTGLHLNFMALGGVNSLYPLDVAEAYDLGIGAVARTFVDLEYKTQNQKWFRDFGLELINTRYFMRTLRGVDGNEFAGVSSFHLHTSIYGGFGLIAGVEVYDRETYPDDLPNIKLSYYTEQLFLVWKL